MTNNDILRRIRFTFNYTDKKMADIFASADFNVTPENIRKWLKKDEDSEFVAIKDQELIHFLDGFINEKRGKKEGNGPAVTDTKFNNNLILKKLKIALNLKTEDIVHLLKLAEYKVSDNEITALFRRPDHHHYRECKEQFLRKFLTGMQLKFSGKPMNHSDKKQPDANQRKQDDIKLKPKKHEKPIVYGEYANSVKVSKAEKQEKTTKKPAKVKRDLSLKNFK